MKRLISLLLILVCVATLFCSCASVGDGKLNRSDEADLAENIPGGYADMTAKLEDLTDAETRKLIRTMDITAETKNFDKFMTELSASVTEKGGYIEKQSVGENYDDLRSGELVIRIPCDKLDSFASNVSELATVTYTSTELDDVTDSYVDVESHIAALETEQEALLELLKKATSVADVMEVQDRLSQVRANLESYKSRKKLYDNQVAYSTVNLAIEEVEKETVSKPSFWQEAGSAISDSTKGLGRFLRGFGVFMVGATPILAFFGIIGVIVLLIIRSARKSARKKKANQQSAENEQ